MMLTSGIPVSSLVELGPTVVVVVVAGPTVVMGPIDVGPGPLLVPSLLVSSVSVETTGPQAERASARANGDRRRRFIVSA